MGGYCKKKKKSYLIFILFIYFVVNSGLTPRATPPVLFCDGFFLEIGSPELFPQAGLEQ
jgi:hypothetical protein